MLGLLCGLLLATAVVWLFALVDAMPIPGFELSVEAVAALIESWGIWGMALSVLLMVLHSFVPFPAELIAMANGMIYGPALGLVITWAGAMLGAQVAFGLARWLGRPFVLAMLAPRHQAALDRWLSQQSVGLLLFSRFLPIISFNLINYAAGLTTVSWWTFSWTTGLGILPLTFLMVALGDGLASDQHGWWLYLLAAIGIGGLVWCGSAWRRASPQRL